LTALIVLVGVLFMQLAVASHACSGLQQSGTPQTMVDDMAPMQPMPGCEQADATQPGLCHAHCMDGKSSVDKPTSPVAAPAVVVVGAILAPFEPLLPAACSGAQPDFELSRVTSPPMAIRHCCFRI